MPINENTNVSDTISNPSHYEKASVTIQIQPIDLVRHLSFCLGNVLKYLFRAPYKGSEIQDLKKAHQYLLWYIEDGQYLYDMEQIKEHKYIVDIFRKDIKDKYLKDKRLAIITCILSSFLTRDISLANSLTNDAINLYNYILEVESKC